MIERFPAESAAEAVAILDGLHLPGLDDHPRATARVHLGILKCAGTDMKGVRDAARLAELDWRDLLVAAGLEHAGWPEVLRRAGLPVP